MSKKLFKKLMQLNKVRLVEKPVKEEKTDNKANKPKKNKTKKVESKVIA